jgi:hypothetical protein
MIVPAEFMKEFPFRRPQWRSERVFEMLAHQPRPLRPRRYDDHFVRAFWRYSRLRLAAADDEQRQERIRLEMPHVSQAHELYHSDVERRYVVEARLLTRESLGTIGQRLGVEARAVEYFHELFFHVRDRMQCSDWLHMAIRIPRNDHTPDRHGALTTAERGFVYRLFALFGGPLVLDAMIACLSPFPKCYVTGDVLRWLDSGTAEILRSRCAMAACVATVDRYSVMRMLKMGMRIKSPMPTADGGEEARQKELRALLAAVTPYISDEDEEAEA